MPRECAGCTLCCSTVHIDVPEFPKVAWSTCQFCSENGCGIHESKPLVCTIFECFWKVTPDFPDKWGPKQSGIMIMGPVPSSESRPTVSFEIWVSPTGAKRARSTAFIKLASKMHLWLENYVSGKEIVSINLHQPGKPKSIFCPVARVFRAVKDGEALMPGYMFGSRAIVTTVAEAIKIQSTVSGLARSIKSAKLLNT